MIYSLIYFLVFLFGLIAGSFLNCVIYRLETNESFLKGRSYCPHCRHILSWQDLIPVLSFLFLKGKCRCCSQKISWQYPLVEFFTGILFVLIFYYSIYNLPSAIYNLIIACFLIIIFIYDLKHYLIPDKIIYPAIATALLYNILYSYFILNTIYAAFGAAAFFLVIVLVSRGKWMGLGDIKLAFFMGLFLSFPNILVALFLAFLIGAIVGIILIITGKKTMKSEVPFGPFLVVGTFLAIFFGERIISWYLNLLLL